MAVESLEKKVMGFCIDLALIAFESFTIVASLWFSVTLGEGNGFKDLELLLF